MQDSIASSGHMTQNHVTQGGHMTPVFPNPTQTPISAPCDRPYSNGMDHMTRQPTNPEVYHSRPETIHEEDDTEVPRPLANGDINGKTLNLSLALVVQHDQ